MKVFQITMNSYLLLHLFHLISSAVIDSSHFTNKINEYSKQKHSVLIQFHKKQNFDQASKYQDKLIRNKGYISYIQSLKPKQSILKYLYNQNQALENKQIFYSNISINNSINFNYSNFKLFYKSKRINYKLNYKNKLIKRILQNNFNKEQQFNLRDREIYHSRILYNSSNVVNSEEIKQVSVSYNEYIKNGNFSVNICPSSDQECLWSKSQYKSNLISNWNVINRAQFGNGNLYNLLLDSNKVVKLGANGQSCIYQDLTIPSGIFNLTYFYTATQLVNTTYSSFTIDVQGFITQEILQYDYDVHSQTEQIKNYKKLTNIRIKFCGKSHTSTPCAAILLNVSLIKVGQTKYSTQVSALLNNTLQLTVQSDALKFISKIPGTRMVMNRFMTFFVNIDHLWLYIYHQRDYGTPVKTILQSINSLQDLKWKALNQNIVQNTIGLSETSIIETIDFKKKYASSTFSLIENIGNTFLAKNFRFIFPNTFLVTIFFLFGKALYKLLAQFSVSSYFQLFSSNIYLIMMLLYGNVEPFSYLFASDCTKLFSLSFIVKSFNIITLLLFFFFLFIVLSGYYLLLGLSRDQSSHFYDNCKANIVSCTYLFVQNGLINICFGMVHMVFQANPDLQLILLSLIQGLYISFLILNLVSNKKLFEYKYLIWINLITSFMRTMLILTFQWYDAYNFTSVTVIQHCQQLIITLYLFIWIVSFLISFMIFFKKIFIKVLQRLKTYYKNKIVGADKNKVMSSQKDGKNEDEQIKLQKEPIDTLKIDNLSQKVTKLELDSKTCKKLNKLHNSPHNQNQIQSIKTQRQIPGYQKKEKVVKVFHFKKKTLKSKLKKKIDIEFEI